jgi:hypothetical protein
MRDSVPKTHTVATVEHLSAIADANGFVTNRPIWEHANNAELKAKRKSPHLLLEGDEVFIPDKVARVETGSTAASHRFVVKLDRIQLHLRLLDFTDKPVSGAPVDLRAGSVLSEKETNGEGQVKAEIPRSTLVGRLLVFGKDGDRTKPPLVEYALRVGGLNPIDTEEGCIQRLNNLGYRIPHEDEDENGKPIRDEDEVRSSVEEFQCDHSIKVTGELDGPTKAKLLKVYGG